MWSCDLHRMCPSAARGSRFECLDSRLTSNLQQLASPFLLRAYKTSKSRWAIRGPEGVSRFAGRAQAAEDALETTRKAAIQEVCLAFRSTRRDSETGSGSHAVVVCCGFVPRATFSHPSSFVAPARRRPSSASGAGRPGRRRPCRSRQPQQQPSLPRYWVLPVRVAVRCRRETAADGEPCVVV